MSPLHRPWSGAWTFALMLLTCAAASAQTVALQGMLGSSALLIVNGGAPKAVAAGSVHQGVKVVSTAGDQAVVEIAGQRHTLRVGEAPASVGGTGGHFLTQGAINGQSAIFMVDTGATMVSMSAADAQRLGLNYKAGQMGYSNTANGMTPAWRLKLASVRVGDVEIYDVD